MNALDAQILAAHAAEDLQQLVTLYAQAADMAVNEDAAGFYLTHAYVFALEKGLPEAHALRSRLIVMGRETAL